MTVEKSHDKSAGHGPGTACRLLRKTDVIQSLEEGIERQALGYKSEREKRKDHKGSGCGGMADGGGVLRNQKGGGKRQ